MGVGRAGPATSLALASSVAEGTPISPPQRNGAG